MVFGLRPLFHNKSPVDCPAGLLTEASPKFSEPPVPASMSSAPPTMVVQSVNPPVAKMEPRSSPSDDPEKIALLISNLSEVEVCKWLASLTNQDLTGNTGRLLLRRWVELDPIAAINWGAQLADAATRQELVGVAAVAWSEMNLPDALTWVESLPENETKHQTLANLGYEVARVDPVSAMQMVAQLPASDNANSLLLHSLAQFASVDAEQSQQLALTLPSGSLRDQALATIATVQAGQDGEAAARFAVANIAPGSELNRAVMGVVQLWGQNNFAAASAWVQSFPDSPVRDQAVQSLGILGAH